MDLAGPYRSTTLELVYGSIEYVRSVFGDGVITRQHLIDYYSLAEETWFKMDIPFGVSRDDIIKWCRSVDVKGLHYYAPMGVKHIFLKDHNDALMFKLRWGC